MLVHINGFNSNLEHIHFGAPQYSLLEPLLFFIHINDLNCAIRYGSVHHFAGVKSVYCGNKSV